MALSTSRLAVLSTATRASWRWAIARSTGYDGRPAVLATCSRRAAGNGARINRDGERIMGVDPKPPRPSCAQTSSTPIRCPLRPARPDHPGIRRDTPAPRRTSRAARRANRPPRVADDRHRRIHAPAGGALPEDFDDGVRLGPQDAGGARPVRAAPVGCRGPWTGTKAGPVLRAASDQRLAGLKIAKFLTNWRAMSVAGGQCGAGGAKKQTEACASGPASAGPALR